MRWYSLLAIPTLLLLLSCGKSPENVTKAEADLNSILERYRVEDQESLRSTPRVFYQNDRIKITLPNPHPSGFAVRDPNGEWYYLQGDDSLPATFMPPDTFAKIRDIEIIPSEVFAINYLDGEPRRSAVFHQTGEYLIYIADDLETEPENTVSFQTTVYYFHKDGR